MVRSISGRSSDLRRGGKKATCHQFEHLYRCIYIYVSILPGKKRKNKRESEIVKKVIKQENKNLLIMLPFPPWLLDRCQGGKNANAPLNMPR